MSLNELLHELAVVRRRVSQYTKLRKKAKEAMEATQEGVLFAQYTELRKGQVAREADLYDQVVRTALDMDPGELPGVIEIKQMSVVVDVVPDVEEWAREHLPAVFVFDRGRFDAAVEAGLVPDSVARMGKKPKPFVKRDLSTYLED